MTVAVLKEYLPLLKLVKSLNAKDTKALIPYLSDGALEALCGTVGACMHSDTLSKKRRTELRHKLRHKKTVLRALAQLPASATREKKTALLAAGRWVSRTGPPHQRRRPPHHFAYLPCHPKEIVNVPALRQRRRRRQGTGVEL
jgi:hypothetical protein